MLDISRIKIRKAIISDIPRLVELNKIVHELHVAAYPGLFRPDPPNDIVANAFKTAMVVPSSFWLLAEKEQPIAFMNSDFKQRPETWCTNAYTVCYIGGIVVEPKSRNKGLAHALLDALKREAKSRNANRIELDVWSFNHEARQVFIKLGFTKVMERMELS